MTTLLARVTALRQVYGGMDKTLDALLGDVAEALSAAQGEWAIPAYGSPSPWPKGAPPAPEVTASPNVESRDE